MKLNGNEDIISLPTSIVTYLVSFRIHRANIRKSRNIDSIWRTERIFNYEFAIRMRKAHKFHLLFDSNKACLL